VRVSAGKGLAFAFAYRSRKVGERRAGGLWLGATHHRQAHLPRLLHFVHV
jgi:hypothetical protein